MTTNRYVVDHKADPASSGLQGELRASYADLVRRFGQPSYSVTTPMAFLRPTAITMPLDGKVSSEWIFREVETGYIFTVYDYKETRLYASDRPTVAAFRKLPEVAWHIGGQRGSGDAAAFVAWLRSELEPLRITAAQAVAETAKPARKPRAPRKPTTPKFASIHGVHLKGKLVVLKAKDYPGDERARTFICEDGFGAHPRAMGSAVFGRFVTDRARKCRIERYEIEGLAPVQEAPPPTTDDVVPDPLADHFRTDTAHAGKVDEKIAMLTTPSSGLALEDE